MRRSKAVSIPLLGLAVTLAIGMTVAGEHPIWLVGIAVVCLGLGILTADLSGPRDPHPIDESLVGRQQIRQATRQEAYRQIGGAPVARTVKRQAARDIARGVTREESNG